jgi:hypothetical protein
MWRKHRATAAGAGLARRISRVGPLPAGLPWCRALCSPPPRRALFQPASHLQAANDRCVATFQVCRRLASRRARSCIVGRLVAALRSSSHPGLLGLATAQFSAQWRNGRYITWSIAYSQPAVGFLLPIHVLHVNARAYTSTTYPIPKQRKTYRSRVL